MSTTAFKGVGGAFSVVDSIWGYAGASQSSPISASLCRIARRSRRLRRWWVVAGHNQPRTIGAERRVVHAAEVWAFELRDCTAARGLDQADDPMCGRISSTCWPTSGRMASRSAPTGTRRRPSSAFRSAARSSTRALSSRSARRSSPGTCSARPARSAAPPATPTVRPSACR